MSIRFSQPPSRQRNGRSLRILGSRTTIIRRVRKPLLNRVRNRLCNRRCSKDGRIRKPGRRRQCSPRARLKRAKKKRSIRTGRQSLKPPNLPKGQRQLPRQPRTKRKAKTKRNNRGREESADRTELIRPVHFFPGATELEFSAQSCLASKPLSRAASDSS